MTRIHFAIAAALAAVLVAVAPAGASRAALPKLTGTVGPGFTITLKKAGKKVMKLKAGRYVDHDQGPLGRAQLPPHRAWAEQDDLDLGHGHDHVDGPAQKGTYKFVCDPHAPIMHGSFKVS